LGVDRLRAANPNCVWVSITPATTGGPIADLPAFDLLAQARSGLMGITGEAVGQPSKVGAPVADVVTVFTGHGLLADSSLVYGAALDATLRRRCSSQP